MLRLDVIVVFVSNTVLEWPVDTNIHHLELGSVAAWDKLDNGVVSLVRQNRCNAAFALAFKRRRRVIKRTHQVTRSMC